MIEWTLRTLLPVTGVVTVKGREDGDDIVFDHPSEEGEILLRVSVARAEEIATWPGYKRARLNMTIERRIIHVGKEFDRPVLPYENCVFCERRGVVSTVTIIDDDFRLHALPWCKEWIASDKTNKPVFETQADSKENEHG